MNLEEIYEFKLTDRAANLTSLTLPTKSIVIIIIRSFPFSFGYLCCRLAFYQQNALEPLIFTILFNNFRLNILDLF